MINTTTIANSASIRAFTQVFWRENLLRFGGFFCSFSSCFFCFRFSSSIRFLSTRDVCLLILVTCLYVKSLLTLTDGFLKNVLSYVVLYYYVYLCFFLFLLLRITHHTFLALIHNCKILFCYTRLHNTLPLV